MPKTQAEARLFRPALSKALYECFADLEQSLRKWAPANASSRRYDALLAIKSMREREQITIGHLAAQLEIKQAAAARLLRRLVSDGMVRRSGNGSNVVLALTARGRTTVERMTRKDSREVGCLAEKVERLLTGLTPNLVGHGLIK